MKKFKKVPKENSIEFIRFVAATGVMFAHIPNINIGFFGVDIFFVISGFIIMLSTEVNKKKFFLKRLFRILPTYYFFTIGVFLIALFYPSLLNNTTANFFHLIKSFLFIPFDKNGAGHFPILFLGWTLNYEIFYYLIFALALIFSDKNRSLVSTGILTLIFILCKDSKELPLVAYNNLIIFEFVIGMIIYEILIKRNMLKVIIILFMVLPAILINEGIILHRLIKYGLPAALFCLTIIILFRNIKFPKIFITLGGASYSLYLVHPYIIQTVDKIFHFSGGYMESFIALFVSIIGSYAIAVLVYKYLEIPIQKYLRRKFIYN